MKESDILCFGLSQFQGNVDYLVGYIFMFILASLIIGRGEGRVGGRGGAGVEIRRRGGLYY